MSAMKTFSKKKKMFGTAVSVLLAGLLASGCGQSAAPSSGTSGAAGTSGSGGSAPAAGSSKQGVTIVLASSANWTKDVDRQLA